MIAKAEHKIVLVDNYVDVGTLNILSKKKAGVDVIIYTMKQTRLSENDVQNFNLQYPTLVLRYTGVFHDRFLILDDKNAYHIGASLKDAGKKCFAVSLIEDKHMVQDIIARLEIEADESEVGHSGDDSIKRNPG